MPVSPLPQKPARRPDHEAALFNVPRRGQSRPEHHKPVMHNPLSLARDWAKGQVHKLAENAQQKLDQRSDFDPYKSQAARPSSTASSPDVVEIARPLGYQGWTTKPAGPPLFSSKAYASDNHVDLTKSNASSPTNRFIAEEGFSMSDPSMYLDSEKANENLKALFEGAFEDEEDTPQTRLRKKKKNDKAADDLADQLKGLEVNDGAEKAEAEKEEDEEEEEDDGTVEGLKVKLLPHQIEGVNWMRDKETGTKKTRGVLPKGGILADDMGLGKTIQSIALLLTNPLPHDYDPKPPAEGEATKKAKKGERKLPPGLDKGTLVVAPLALIKQWEAEIKDRVEDSHTLKVLVHHGPQRAKRPSDLKKYDVVITTYQILVSEHNASDMNGKLRVGVFGVNWYRIILDEAHTIKNRNAKATQAAYHLPAEYRWCLTGTPMQNNLDELQSLIKFLRIKPYDDLANWREQITKPMNSGRGGLAIRRLQVYLKAFMKRRTKDILKQEGALRNGPIGTKEDGKPAGFKIVKRTVEKVVADFTEEEREFYNRLEQRTDKSLEQMMSGNALSYASALVLLLRLRQACNHPQLVKSDLSKEKEAFSGAPSGLQSPRKKTAVRSDDIDSIADMLGGLSMETKRCDVCQIELSTREASTGAIRCRECEADLGKGLASATKKHKRSKKKKEKSTHSKLAAASRNRNNRRVIHDSDDEEDDDNSDKVVPKDQQLYPDLGKFGSSDDEDAEGEGDTLGPDDSDTEDEDIAPRRPKKAVVTLISDDEDDGSRSSAEEDEDGDSKSDSEEDVDSSDDEYSSANSAITAANPVISTKIRKLLKILQHDSHTHKYIIFSFFTSMLDLLEPFLVSHNLPFTRYDGSMRNDLREASLDRLRNHSGTRILLCSLRAGSLGLNLTAASRVVILEPFWNPFVEEQAIDRVHRLNQTQDVIVHKITIKDTVEERILDLQNRKRELANATIEAGVGDKKSAAAKLTLRDMLALFRHDAESSAKIDNIGMGLGGNMGPGAGGSSSGTGGGSSRPWGKEYVRDAMDMARGGGVAGAGRRDGGSGSYGAGSSQQRGMSGLSSGTSAAAGAAKRPEHAVYGRRW